MSEKLLHSYECVSIDNKRTWLDGLQCMHIIFPFLFVHIDLFSYFFVNFGCAFCFTLAQEEEEFIAANVD